MEILIGVVIVLIGGAVLIAALAPLLAVGSLSKDEKSRAQAVNRASEILDATFAGADAVFHVGPRTLPYETVILGARERGYVLLSETSDSPLGDRKTLVFTKAREAAGP